MITLCVYNIKWWQTVLVLADKMLYLNRRQ